MVYITDSRGRLSLQMRLLVSQFVGQGLAPAVSPIPYVAVGAFINRKAIYRRVAVFQSRISDLHCRAMPKGNNAVDRAPTLRPYQFTIF